MTKPRTKTREELTAEIEQAEKKIRQYENKEKILDRKLAIEKRKERNHDLCVRGGFMENLAPELITMTDENTKPLLARLDRRVSKGFPSHWGLNGPVFARPRGTGYGCGALC